MPKTYSPIPTLPDGYGLDLSTPDAWKQMRSIVVRATGLRASKMGIEVDDLIQDVARKILTANQGAHPFDPERASPAKYIWLQATSVLSHRSRSAARRASMEQTGILTRGKHGEALWGDVAASDRAIVPEHYGASYEAAVDRIVREVEVTSDKPFKPGILRLLVQGYSHSEITAKGHKKYHAHKASTAFRDAHGQAMAKVMSPPPKPQPTAQEKYLEMIDSLIF